MSASPATEGTDKTKEAVRRITEKARMMIGFSLIAKKHYAKVVLKISQEEKDSSDIIVLDIRIKTELVCKFLVYEMNMPQYAIDRLVVETTWSANQVNWQMVFISFADMESVALVYWYADMLCNPTRLVKYEPATMCNLVDFSDRHL